MANEKIIELNGLSRFLDNIKTLLLGKKDKQTAVSDPTASGAAIEFIDSISQDANGVVTPTKKSVREASASQSGVVSTGAQTFAGNKTIEGNLFTSGAGENYVEAQNTAKGTSVSLYAGSGGGVGLYTQGYWDGTGFVSDPGWQIVRMTDGTTRLPQSAAGDTNVPVYIASNGAVTACGNTLFKIVAQYVTYSCAANGVVGPLNAAPSLSGYSPAAVLSIETNSASVVPRTWTAAGQFYLRNVTSTAVNNVNLKVTWLMVNSNLIS